MVCTACTDKYKYYVLRTQSRTLTDKRGKRREEKGEQKPIEITTGTEERWSL